MGKILTIDVGTSALKVALFDAAAKMLRLETRPYRRAHFDGLEAEQDPREWWDLTRELIRDFTDALGPERTAIRALAVTGQMHGVVLLGPDGPLGPVMTFQDRRAQREYEELLRHQEIFYRITGARIDAGMVPAKLLHISRHTPALIEEAEFVLPPKDYIRYELTGAVNTDPIDAAGLLLYDLQRGRWSTELCELTGFDSRRLPEVLPTVSAAPAIRKDVARDLGLPEDVMVAVSGGDDIEALGSGMTSGDIYEHLGGSGSMYAATTEFVCDPERRLEVYPDVLPGWYLVGGSTSAAGSAEQWFRKLTGEKTPDISAGPLGIPEGPSDVVFLPYLAGARCPIWDPERTGAFVGLSLSVTTDDLRRAVAEGVAYSLRSILERLETLELGARGVVYATGGFGADAAFGQVRADIYGREVRRVVQAEATSFAAMLIAGTVAGLFDDVETAAARFREVAWSVGPREHVRTACDEGYARFVEVGERLRGGDR